MTQHNLTQILKVIRDLVMRNRPCYRDYLGSETVTKTVQIGSGVFEGFENGAKAQFIATDSSFTGFVLGETYTVTIDGVTADYVARNFSLISEETGPIIGTITTYNTEDNTFDGWICVAGRTPDGKAACMAQTFDTSFVGKTISISQTRTETVKHYNTKLLPEYLLPTFLRKNVVATKTEVQNAQTAADSAQSTADSAQSTADSAQSTAREAQRTANTAKNTAAAAQSMANTAKTTADAAFPKTGGDITGNVKISGRASFPATYTSSSGYPTIITGLLLSAGVGSGIVRIHMGTSGLDPSYSSITAIETELDGIRIHKPNVLADSGYSVVRMEVKGVRLSFVDYYNKTPKTICAKDIILQSSTADSTKKFKITVDDSGTISATEVNEVTS